MDESDEIFDRSDKLSDKSDRIFNERYLIMGTTAIPSREDERVVWTLNFEDVFHCAWT